jgi:molybdenum cofactor cytidylyltransferase
VTTAPGLVVMLLAAGRSTRMGGPNKLLQDWRGRPLVRHAAEAALATGAPVLVVTGHQADAVAAALAGLAVTLVHNPDAARGLSSSLQAGFAALPAGAARIAVMLGDMPLVGAEIIRRLDAALAAAPDRVAAVPVLAGEWGNPVVLARSLEPRILALSGDAGARKVLEALREQVVTCPMEDDSVATDIDTPEALGRLRQR